MILEQRVIFGDTDAMGVVYYANYLRYFEASRAAYLRHLGRSQQDLDEWGVALPVTEVSCRYRRPAYYEDLLEVDVQVAQLRGASMRFEYAIRRGDELVAEGFSVHACIGPDGRPRRIPEPLRALLAAEPRG